MKTLLLLNETRPHPITIVPMVLFTLKATLKYFSALHLRYSMVIEVDMESFSFYLFYFHSAFVNGI